MPDIAGYAVVKNVDQQLMREMRRFRSEELHWREIAISFIGKIKHRTDSPIYLNVDDWQIMILLVVAFNVR